MRTNLVEVVSDHRSFRDDQNFRVRFAMYDGMFNHMMRTAVASDKNRALAAVVTPRKSPAIYAHKTDIGIVSTGNLAKQEYSVHRNIMAALCGMLPDNTGWYTLEQEDHIQSFSIVLGYDAYVRLTGTSMQCTRMLSTIDKDVSIINGIRFEEANEFQRWLINGIEKKTVAGEKIKGKK